MSIKLGLILEIAIVISGFTPPAQAETKRARIPLSSIPKQDSPATIRAADAVLPDGAREGSAVPASWKFVQWGAYWVENAHCTDDRRGSVLTGDPTEHTTSTDRVWEANGKTFVDRARVKIEGGKVHVVSAQRLEVAHLTDAIWAYRRGAFVVLVVARDTGVNGKAISFGCALDEVDLGFPGSVSIESRPDLAKQVQDAFREEAARPPPPWKGRKLTALVTTSKSSADAEAMLGFVVQTP
jgi:hypothetical protein